MVHELLLLLRELHAHEIFRNRRGRWDENVHPAVEGMAFLALCKTGGMQEH
jgi:hypothetical protein